MASYGSSIFHHSHTQKKLSWAKTHRLSHQTSKSVQALDLRKKKSREGKGRNEKIDCGLKKYGNVILHHLIL